MQVFCLVLRFGKQNNIGTTAKITFKFDMDVYGPYYMNHYNYGDPS